MRTVLAAAVLLCLAAPGWSAPAASDVAIVAAARLAEAPNYSWTASIENGENGGVVRFSGQTVRNGYATVTTRNPPGFLANRNVARNSDGAIQMFFRGPDRCVILTEDGWLPPEELPAALPYAERNVGRTGRAGRSGGSRAAPSFIPDKAEDHTFEMRLPHEELDLIIGGFTTIRAAGNTFTGELTQAGAALFLSAFAQPRVQVRQASGIFRCWIEGGVVVRYEIQINGTVNLPGDRNALPVNWTISTEIHDLGTTRLTVPAAVRAKLG